MIVFIKHIDIEGPDTLEPYFQERGFQVQTIDLQKGDYLPDDFDAIDAVISLGGPMSVYDEERCPFLKSEDQFIKQIVEREIPFLGICLGSQLLAKACGAKVNRSPEKEVGFFPITVKQDKIFEGLSGEIDVFHWHEDMSELPDGADLLASSSGCPHQAFKVGTNAYGLQFHIEVTEPTIFKWIEAYFSSDDSVQMKQKILDDYKVKKERFHKTADIISGNFLKVIRSYKGEKSPL